MFTSASQRLYLASKQHVYWRQIKILVPNTWPSRSQYRSARTETLQSANIIVHEFPDDEPLVNNIAGCGKEGSLLHLTPRYVLDEQYREDKFGNTDNVLVRSWGYYRWGLFREHYSGNGDGFPAYDSPTGGTEGTRCSFKLKGSVKMPSGYPCQSDPHTGYKPECRFVPDTGGQTATGSLLFAPNDAHIPSVVKFCEDDNADLDSLHNALAPNLMNKLCGGDSAWKVMTERTEDFQAGVQQSADTSPEFEVVQASSVRSGAIVFVLDISGSMAGSRFDQMIQACTAFINSVMPSDIKIGIVVFQSSAGIRADLTDITNIASRRHVVDSLPSEATGGTCIGCGILKGIEVLGEYARGGYILLLSDGRENNSPVIRDTYEEIEDSGIYSSDISISNHGSYNIPIVVDSTVGSETVVIVFWTQSQMLSIAFTGPDGNRIDRNHQRYQLEAITKIVTITLPEVKAVNFARTRALAIYAQVQQDYQSVSNANVTAIIRDSSKTTTVTLKDNGSGE
nr:calcium-activated chloride channel regulator 1-like [Lytechinus pictus]